jgi:hypothetical protein
MKRIPLISSILLLSLALNAQMALGEKPKNIPGFDLKRLHFGFTVGFNAMDLSIKRNYEAENFLYADVSEVSYGFQVGAVSDLRLSDNFNLRFLPGISFGSRQVFFYDYSGNGQGDLADYPDADNPVSLGPSFLDFPLQLKYRSNRENNYRPYVIGGLNFRYDMSAKRNFDSESQEFLKFKPAGLYLEIGFGVDTYLKYFKFAPELKLAIGLNNIITEDTRPPYPEFVNSIERATSYMVLLNFHFE